MQLPYSTDRLFNLIWEDLNYYLVFLKLFLQFKEHSLRYHIDKEWNNINFGQDGNKDLHNYMQTGQNDIQR